MHVKQATPVPLSGIPSYTHACNIVSVADIGAPRILLLLRGAFGTPLKVYIPPSRSTTHVTLSALPLNRKKGIRERTATITTAATIRMAKHMGRPFVCTRRVIPLLWKHLVEYGTCLCFTTNTVTRSGGGPDARTMEHEVHNLTGLAL